MPSETQTLPERRNSAQNLIFLLLCAGFVVNGIIITFIGPILPIFIGKWKLDDSHAGMFFMTQFVGSFVGVLGSSALISARGFKPEITIGLAIVFPRSLRQRVFRHWLRPFHAGHKFMGRGDLWRPPSFGTQRYESCLGRRGNPVFAAGKDFHQERSCFAFAICRWRALLRPRDHVVARALWPRSSR